MRIGHGYDAHKFAENRKCIICGVEVPFEQGLAGHSDADVAVHALMDALLGAAALGDIGQMFPDTDDKWKDADSIKLLEAVMQRLNDNGYNFGNCDITIVAQKPKMKAYIPQMRQNIADAVKCDVGQVSVKATTEEGMGFTGRVEGISAHAVVIIE
ncbi:MAG: 2-C-methyl-D-erythritol 2,4-cyclodiphosphate synthase [Oscillospiraceae bacterium]|nr:2-C-methyl-D-erythritol 2,4-cyclodiphosphate synthase [Oscillospiraceae bacterium]